MNGERGSKRNLKRDADRGLGVQPAGVDRRRRLPRAAAQVDLDAVAALGDLDLERVAALGVVDAVGVEHVLGLVDAVGQQLGDRLAHRLGRHVARVAHRAVHRLEPVALDRLLQLALAEAQVLADRLDVRQQQAAEAGVVEDQAPGRLDRLVCARRAAAARSRGRSRRRSAWCRRSRPGTTPPMSSMCAWRFTKRRSLPSRKTGRMKQHVVDVGADPVRVVDHQDVALVQVLRAVLLDGGAHGVGHRADEEHQRVRHRRHRVARARGGPEIVAAKSYQSRRITQNALFSSPCTCAGRCSGSGCRGRWR